MCRAVRFGSPLAPSPYFLAIQVHVARLAITSCLTPNRMVVSAFLVTSSFEHYGSLRSLAYLLLVCVVNMPLPWALVTSMLLALVQNGYQDASATSPAFSGSRYYVSVDVPSHPVLGRNGFTFAMAPLVYVMLSFGAAFPAFPALCVLCGIWWPARLALTEAFFVPRNVAGLPLTLIAPPIEGRRSLKLDGTALTGSANQ